MTDNKHYDRTLRDMIRVLQSDYAGTALTARPVDDQYYVQAAGQAWHDGKLDGLLFMRLTSQMTATTKDRTLRVGLNSPSYVPWHAGFDCRRYGDSLYVTAVHGDKRLTPGDEIKLLNINTPKEHMYHFQRNFLYADEAEREMWNNVLKMTAHMTVRHANGKEEDIPVMKFSSARTAVKPSVKAVKGGVIVLNAGTNPDQEEMEKMVETHRTQLDYAEHLVIDLRKACGTDIDAYIPLMPYVMKEEQSLDEAFGEQVWYTLYTDGNCSRMVSALQEYAGNPEADALISEYKENSGTGWKENRIRLFADLTEKIVPRGNKVTLLTDTWTENAAEIFALFAKQQGRAKTAGRPTMGTLDFGDLVTVALTDEITLTYPVSITAEAKEGRGYCNKGIPADLYIPFTPEECTEDLILKAVLNQK